MSTPELRVLVLGCPGSGKSTLATRLARALDCPSFSIDEVIGVAETRVPRSEWGTRVRECTDGPNWVFEGNVLDTLDIRSSRATHVVLLTTPRLLCLWRVWHRRHDLEAPVPFSLALAIYILRYGRSRTQHLALVMEHARTTHAIWRVSGRDTPQACEAIESRLLSTLGETL